MTQQISGQTAAARETARTSTGQFGTQPKSEAELELDPQYAHETAMADRYAACFRGHEDDEFAAAVTMTFQAADQHNRARMDRAFPGLRMAADEASYGPQIYGPARVDDNDIDPPHWASYRHGKGGYSAGSFTTNLMDLYDAETTTDNDRQAISQWWPHLAAALDEHS